MKKTLILATLLAVSTSSAIAGGRDSHYGHRSHGWNWFGPALVGGFIGYELNRQPVYSPPTVIYQSPQPVYLPAPAPIVVRETIQTQRFPAPLTSPRCTAWTETEHSDGSVTRTRTCSD